MHGINLGDQRALNFKKSTTLAKNMKFYRCIFLKIHPDKEFMTISSVISCSIDRQNANFGQIYKFSRFLWFSKVIATAFFLISKISTVIFWIHSFPCYLFKTSLFSGNTNLYHGKLDLV